ncbi:hypothetical protein CEXT_244221 [Caerostris extrusa]|uniref:Uncharacterized protein n=1 Tax=Caerostris extrusa TaxID=172846 RepID=A0AAV4X3R7_CAEEX|nr:hypothetical protein CEXT_244221 [Caerostris extrusa]
MKGNRQTLPRSTANPITANKNSAFLSQVSLSSWISVRAGGEHELADHQGGPDFLPLEFGLQGTFRIRSWNGHGSLRLVFHEERISQKNEMEFAFSIFSGKLGFTLLVLLRFPPQLLLP